MKRIAILTAGGDTPALNAHSRRRRRANHWVEVYGLIKGYNGLLNPRVPHVIWTLFQAIPELDPTGAAHLARRATTSTRREDNLDLIA